jgi:hypothetical protein
MTLSPAGPEFLAGYVAEWFNPLTGESGPRGEADTYAAEGVVLLPDALDP